MLNRRHLPGCEPVIHEKYLFSLDDFLERGFAQLYSNPPVLELALSRLLYLPLKEPFRA
jgi:hypothetical protein